LFTAIKKGIEMSKQHKQSVIWTIAIAAVVLAAVVIWRAAFFIPRPQIQTEHFYNDPLAVEPLGKNIGESAKADTQRTGPKMTISDILRYKRYWRPAFESWYGKPAPDFTLADTDGQKHRLSNYRGKNVIIVFWATWCGPCRIEVPELIALRNTVSEKKLAILAISNENLVSVKRFIAQQKFNYTVLLNQTGIPAPFGLVRAIPSSFFIRPNGTIKLATTGPLSLGAMKAILEAD